MKVEASQTVSFIMTVKNGAPFLADAIASIKNQTYRNWDAVVVDDGSTDATFATLEALCGGDSRFKLVRTAGVGRGRALNIAWKAADGHYICNLDADDMAHPLRAEYQVHMAQRHGCDLHCGRMVQFSVAEQVEWAELIYDTPRNVVPMLMNSNPVGHSTVIIRRDALERVGGYSEVRRMQFDYDLWGRMAAAKLKLTRSDSVICAKRIHAGQSFENKTRVKYVYSSFMLQNKIISDLEGRSAHRLVALTRLGYGLLPQWFRMAVRKGRASVRSTRRGV